MAASVSLALRGVYAAAYSVQSPRYSPTSPVAYSPTSPVQGVTSPAYDEAAQEYSPTSPAYEPTGRRHSASVFADALALPNQHVFVYPLWPLDRYLTSN